MNRRGFFKRLFGSLTAGAAAFCLGDVSAADKPSTCRGEEGVWSGVIFYVTVDGELYEWNKETDMFERFTESKHD